MIRLIFLLILGAPVLANAKPTIYTCNLNHEASFAWEQPLLFGKAGMKASASNNESETSVTLVIDGEKVFLKGNLDQVPLSKVSQNTFLEVTSGGNVVTWNLFEGDNELPPYLVSQKAYKLVRPSAWLAAYKCK